MATIDLSDRCACCSTVETPCNPQRVQKSLRDTFRYMLNGDSPKWLETVFLAYSPTACGPGSPGWSYDTPSPDIEICDGFFLRAVLLCCTGTSWSLIVVTVENGEQIVYNSGGTISSVTTVTTNPIYLTAQSVSEIDTNCGTGRFYIDIEEIAAISPCCGTDPLPATGTLTYTINALAPATLNLTKIGNAYVGGLDCDVGDGHTHVIISYVMECSGVSGAWDGIFKVTKRVDGVDVSSVTWTPVGTPGTISASFQASCDPYHVHYSGLNNAGVIGGGASQVCGGVTYPFAVAGNINLVLDAVTP